MTLDDFAHKWVAYLTAMGEGDWRPFFCKNLPDIVQPEIKGQKRAGYLPFHLSSPMRFRSSSAPWFRAPITTESEWRL